MMLSAGSVVGHFRVQSALGAGGMGVVYLAEDVNLKRQVALKFLAHDKDGQDRRRLIREAQITSGLDHPNSARVYEVGEWESVPYIALAYCAGETVQQKLARGSFRPRRSSRFCVRLLTAWPTPTRWVSSIGT